MVRKFVEFHLFALIAGISLQSATGQAFEVKTHEKMSLRSVDPAVSGASTLDSFLRGVFNNQLFPDEFSDGILTSVKGKQARGNLGQLRGLPSEFSR